ncbi:type II secretion system F family protein [Citromicrobium bathyomarinum]|uniref:type II secretion system F family protein n=1 Tax=Sphingomonadales TaxID=204457 RepID=UPI000C382059|nr:type II secretion system F family protein [Citromicrobium sp.]MBO80517.1 pilus assembly protein TadB [Citromicrobium sp.]|tara:strand:- start:14304 stop:15275 length:972 start_codon:yes stop_codon:yes gene_type:complete
MDFIQLLPLLIGMAAAVGLVMAAFIGPSTRKQVQRRLSGVRYRHSESSEAKVESQMKKAMAARKPKVHKVAGSGSRTEALAIRLQRTGRSWTVSQYIYVSLGLSIVLGLILYLQTGVPLLSLVGGVFIGAGLPHLVVNFFIKRRTTQFITKFPDAIDLLVRGLRSGLPVTETLAVVAQEISGPVGIEFKGIIERIKIGRSMEDAMQVSADRLNVPEFNFFTITLAIQRETGGNLAETLSNLSDVLRKRSQMKLKIKAMSSESKASAYIVGSLPFLVFAMIWWINPNYLGAFFVDERLMVIGLGGLVWMGLGVFIMAKMVSFEI